MTGNVLLQEYDYLYPCGAAPAGSSTLDKDSYDHLRKLSLARQSGNPEVFRLRSRDGYECLQARNYVGLVKTPAGANIEILPKTMDGEESSARAGKLLLKMLAVVSEIPMRELDDASLGAHEHPLIEVLIRKFLDETNYLVHRGLRRDYQRISSTKPYIKGRLNINKQMRQPAAKLETFHVEFDAYSVDTPENRLIKLALEKVLRLSTSGDNQRMAKQLLPTFGQATNPHDIEGEFSRWRNQRDMVHYRPLKPWVTLLLRNLSPMLYTGQWQGISMLFPMERLFEKYVGFCLRQQLPRAYKVIEQASREHLVKHAGANWFQLQPDMLVHSEGRNVSVLDTKWKLLDSGCNNSKDKYKMSQQDLYQLFTYGEKYLGGSGAMYLIYPSHRQFNTPLPEFQFTEKLSLWAVPFDLDSEEILFPPGHFEEPGLALIA